MTRDRKENHDYENDRENITRNQTVHQRAAGSRLCSVDRSSAIKGMVGAERGSNAQDRSRHASRGKVSLGFGQPGGRRSEEHTSELQSPYDLVCRRLLEK